MITLVLDEIARIAGGGGLDLTDFLAVSRSKNVSVILCAQSISQLESVWGKEQAVTLTEVVSTIAVLSCASESMARLVCSWCSTYYAERISTTVGGKSDGSYNRSFEEKKVLDPADIMSLRRKGKVILFLNGEYFCVNVTRARYFNIPKLNEISQKCVEAHKRLERR